YAVSALRYRTSIFRNSLNQVQLRYIAELLHWGGLIIPVLQKLIAPLLLLSEHLPWYIVLDGGYSSHLSQIVTQHNCQHEKAEREFVPLAVHPLTTYRHFSLTRLYKLETLGHLYLPAPLQFQTLFLFEKYLVYSKSFLCLLALF